MEEGERGFCGVRGVRDHALETEAWGGSSGFAVDPIEKKPLFHFHPGAQVLSFGTRGCNLDCAFCQNSGLSRGGAPLRRTRPEDIVRMALAQDCLGVAFTYNEPIISAEFCLEVAGACRAAGLASVAVTNGFISEEAREAFFGAMDAVNVDLKGFSEPFYREYCGGRLGPVLETLVHLAQAGHPWLEVTTLLIPGLNDAPDMLAAQFAWMAEHLGRGVPLHLSAFHPAHRMKDRPPTPAATLLRARGLAEEAGLDFVYLGNAQLEDGETTWCPGCGRALIERQGFEVTEMDLHRGVCPECGTTVPGVFSAN